MTVVSEAMRRWGIAVLFVCATLVACGSRIAHAVDNYCTADCAADGAVTVDDVIRAVDIANGVSQLSTCQRADKNSSGTVTIDELMSYAQELCMAA